jgi:hypothetical protein
MQALGKLQRAGLQLSRPASVREAEIRIANAASNLPFNCGNIRFSCRDFLSRNLNAPRSLRPDFDGLIDESAFVGRIARSSETGRRIGALSGDSHARLRDGLLRSRCQEIEVLLSSEIERLSDRQPPNGLLRANRTSDSWRHQHHNNERPGQLHG